MTVDVGVGHPAEVAGVRFLCCEVTPLSLLFHTAHFGRKSLYAAHPQRAEGYAPPPWLSAEIISNSSA